MRTATAEAAKAAVNEALASATSEMNPSRAAFEELLPQIRQVDTEHLAVINLDLFGVVSTMMGSMAEIKGMRPLLVTHFKTFDLNAFDELEKRTLAVNWANAQWRATLRPKRSLTEQAAVVEKRRGDLLASCQVLMHFGYVEEELLQQMNTEQGYQALAADVLTMVNVLRPIWEQVATMTPLTEQDLDEAATDALDLQIGIGLQAQAPALRHEAGIIRAQAYTLFRQAYVAARRAAYYLYGEDVYNEVVPSLYAGRGSASNANPKDEQVEPPEAEPQGSNRAVSDSGFQVTNPQNLPITSVFEERQSS